MLESLNPADLEDWVRQQRSCVIGYLELQGIDSPNVGEWPAFEMAPHFAIWAVESQVTCGKIGWWAFSGDCPTDYVSETGDCHPRAALRELIRTWRGYLPHMKAGHQPPNTKLGDGENLIELADLLERRVEVLEQWYSFDELWQDPDLP
jgi:hypothetical protein